MRSLLTLPEHDRAAVGAGLRSGAGALILDLAASTDASARDTLTAALRVARSVARRPKLLVRVHGLRTGFVDGDLDTVMGETPEGIALPDVRGGADLDHLAVKLAVREAEFDRPDGATAILAIVDSAAGLLNLGSLASVNIRLAGLAWDAAGLAREIGATSVRDGGGGLIEPCRTARSLILFAAAAAGVPAFDTARPDADPETFAAECRAAARDGFAGKLAASPAQVRVVEANWPGSPGSGAS